MILEVVQTKAAGENTFEVIQNDTVLYRGETTWLPMGVDKVNKIKFSDPEGKLIFQSKYSVIENVAESSVPMKYVVTGEQKFGQYQIMNSADQPVGSFYEVQNGPMDIKLCISFGNRVILGYSRYIGTREVISIYENDVQIGQITRSLKVVNNLDSYFVHILPEYDEWHVLIAMFTIYYDYRFHNNSGQAFIGTSVNITYTYDKNNKKYNKNFIRENFGEEEHNRVESYLNRKVEMRAGWITVKRFWIIFGAGWAITLLTLLILWLTGILY